MRRTIYMLAIVGGVLAMVGGVAVGAGLGLLAAAGGRGAGAGLLQETTVALAAGFIGVLCGGLLIWSGARGMSGRADSPFRLPGWGWWLVALLVVLAVGQAAFNGPARLAPLLPIFHVLAGSIAALLFLSMAVSAARSRDRAVGARAAASSFAWGALGGAGIALVAELALLIIAVLVAMLWLSVSRPDLFDQIQSWVAGGMQNSGQGPDLGPLAGLASSPLVAVVTLLLIAVAVPLIEETTKSLAVPLVYLARRDSAAPGPADDRERRPPLTRLDGYLIGVAAGAGFTLLEGILNGSLALATPGGWAGIMLLRAGTAAVHCFATGLGGLGWQALLVERRLSRGLAHWLAAAAIHAVWNAGTGLTVIVALASQSGGGTGQIAAAATQLLIAGFMAIGWLAIVVALPLAARSLAGQGQPLPAAEGLGQEE